MRQQLTQVVNARHQRTNRAQRRTSVCNEAQARTCKLKCGGLKSTTAQEKTATVGRGVELVQMTSVEPKEPKPEAKETFDNIA